MAKAGMATLNISLPQNMYTDVKSFAENRGYSSVSELMRDAVRRLLYPHLTVNGFTREFEDSVLQSAAQPVEKDLVFESDEDLENYFLHLKKPQK